MADLYEMLAEALSQPSRGYQAAQEAFGAVKNIDEGFQTYKKRQEEERKRKLQQTPIADILGRMPTGIDESLGRLTPETMSVVEPLSKFLPKEGKTSEKPRYQQANFQYDGKLVLFNPDPDDPHYAVVTDGGIKRIGTQPASGGTSQPPSVLSGGNLPVGGDITPRVAPTLPAGESKSLGDMGALLTDVGIVRGNYDPSFVGMFDAPKTKLSQRSGVGASSKAAIFGSTVAGLRNKVLNLLSGAAISPAEAQRLMDQLPNENMSEIDFNARLNNFERELRLQMDSKRKEFSRAGYRGQSGGETTIQSPQSSAPIRARNRQGVVIESMDGGRTWRPVNGN